MNASLPQKANPAFPVHKGHAFAPGKGQAPRSGMRAQLGPKKKAGCPSGATALPGLNWPPRQP